MSLAGKSLRILDLENAPLETALQQHAIKHGVEHFDGMPKHLYRRAIRALKQWEKRHPEFEIYNKFYDFLTGLVHSGQCGFVVSFEARETN